MIYGLALLIGVIAGLRTMTAPAAVSWAAALGVIHLQGTPLAFLGGVSHPWILSLLALGELVTDQLPSTPSRTVPVQFGARILTGGVCGAAVGASGGEIAGGLRRRRRRRGHRHARRSGRPRALAAAFGSDRPAAFLEDAVAIGGALLTSAGAAMTPSFDAIIIGAGQAGPPLAGRLTGAGMKVALVERKLFGGTCVNTGCMPTKTLVASAYAAHLARRAARLRRRLDGPVGVDMKRGEGARRRRRDERAHGVENVAARHGRRCTVDRRATRASRGRTRVRVGDELLTAPRIFVNVGGRARVPDLPGVGDGRRTSPTARCSTLERLPEHLVVVGGSYIGLEFAQMYRRFGARGDDRREGRRA